MIKLAITLEEFIRRKRALQCLLELKRGPKHVRELIRRVGGTPATVLKRIAELIDMEYAEERLERNRRIIGLTGAGFDRARSIEYLVKPRDPSGREKWILALLWAMGEDKETKRVWGKTRLQKLLFLLKNDESCLVKTVPYDFYPYKRGPFDFNIYEDVRSLESKMLIRIKNVETVDKIGSEMYELTRRGAEFARKMYFSFPKDIRRKMTHLIKFNKTNFIDLMKYVYSKFPQYKVKADPDFIRSMGLDN